MIYSAGSYGEGCPGLKQWRNPLIQAAPRGPVPRSSELKNSMDGIFQQLII